MQVNVYAKIGFIFCSQLFPIFHHLSHALHFSTHRMCSSQAFGPEAGTLSSYPDVVQATTAASFTYHFAPALQFNLAETKAFSECRFGSDQLRDMSTTCPHPHLTYLASSKFHPLESLYVMVRAVPGVSEDRDDGEDLADGPYYMIPLAIHCIQELISAQLLPAANTSASEYADVLPSSSSLQGQSILGCSSLDLLPDHARRKTWKDSPEAFHHRYALIWGQQAIAEKEVAEGEVGDKRRQHKGATPSIPSSASNLHAGCFYLVQLSKTREQKTEHAAPPSPRKGGLLQSNEPAPESISAVTEAAMTPKSIEDELHKVGEGNVY